MEIVVLFGLAALLLLVNVPIAVSLGISAVATVWIFGLAPLNLVPNLAYATVAKFTLLAVPYFIAAGYLMEKSGIAHRLVHFSELLVGKLRGGLAYVTIVVAIFFAGISGSGTADTAALAAILLPSMERSGYSKEFSAALVAAGGGIGIIVPPSITYVLYGAISGASIGKLFIAGIVPGILIGAALAVPSFFEARRSDIVTVSRGSFREVMVATRRASWGMAAPIIILGGIYSGLFTPTEAAGIVVVYAVIVGMLIYRELKPSNLVNVFSEAALITGMALTIVIGASLFSWVVTRLGLSARVAELVTSITTDPVLVVFFLLLILLIVGMVLDAISITFVFIPIFLPLLQAAGIDLVWFGVLFTVVMAIGQVTPPMGVNLFISAGIANARFAGVARAAVPMVGAQIVVLILLVLIPTLTLGLPSLLGM